MSGFIRELPARMSLNLPFERVKHIDAKQKQAISGYIRDINTPDIPEFISLVILLFYCHTLESSILTNEEFDELLSLFEQKEVFNNLGNHSYKLLFKGTRDGFKTNTFYETCSKPKYLMHNRTPNKTFGGYTSIPWQKTNEEKFTPDPLAFVYTVRSNKASNLKIYPVQENGVNTRANDADRYLIFGHNGYGSFGFELEQSGDSEVQGYIYASPGRSGQIQQFELNGENFQFKPKEIEVFELS